VRELDHHPRATFGTFVLLAALAAAVSLVLGSLWRACTGTARRHNAEEQAQEFAEHVYPDTAALSCQTDDVDGNGYVSCYLRLRTGAVVVIECSGAFVTSIARGCRGVRRGL
jgi:hypothetical protein